MSRFEMSPNTQKKVLLLVEELRGALEDNCYFVASGHINVIKGMVERHLKKEVEL